jgi:IclR family KDG regulon transcriptional repressor
MNNQSVYKTFEIIEYLSHHQGNVGLRDLAREVDMPPSTVHRFMASLKDLGYVWQEPKTSKYRLGMKFAWLGSKVLENVQVADLTRPYMEELTADTNETTHLAILDGLEFVYVAKIDGNQAVNMRSRVGHRGALHSTAIGKVFLAYSTQQERSAILQQLDLSPRTKNTIVDKGDLIRQLEEIRDQGYAIDDEENEIGILCVGAPIFDHRGVCAAALSLSGWKVTMTSKRMTGLANDLKLTTAKISVELGHVESVS